MTILFTILLMTSPVFAQNYKKGDVIKSEEKETKASFGKGLDLKLAPKSEIKFLAKNEISLEKGSVLILDLRRTKKNFVVKLPEASFTGKKSQFSVTLNEMVGSSELDVYCGEVTFSSPLVMTFVPEIIKKNSGFTFISKEKSFSKRPLNERGWKIDCK